MYVALFPQLIAGPIVRYIDIEKQIEYREVSLEKFFDGIRRFIIGFSKKILLADTIAPLVDMAFSNQYNSIYLHWIGMLAYTLQIYYDFSGYSDMAIGLGKMFGFDFLENFDYPYISQSIQEFWRRWHISLSSWFRDYVYIPLGGNRKGAVRTYINLVVVFFLTGLWHGASYNFIVWGLFYVLFLIIERLGFASVLKKVPRVFRHFYALMIIMIGWVFFRADNLTLALCYIRDLFICYGNDVDVYNYVMNPQLYFFLIVGIICSFPKRRLFDKIANNLLLSHILDYCIVIIFVISISFMVGGGYSPFLYFRF